MVGLYTFVKNTSTELHRRSSKTTHIDPLEYLLTKNVGMQLKHETTTTKYARLEVSNAKLRVPVLAAVDFVVQPLTQFLSQVLVVDE